MVIGPEGDTAPAEVEAPERIVASCVTLDRRILRTETAGLCALAVTMNVLGEM
ncbi:MAG: 16S rRNA (uracil(1498)-N(3))-methyltransferase [Eubacteriales bacterium]|nr:16S rRNA (uracil(1498)-N(3))-methyltransferase [Eubacteriales bacterium]